MIYLNIVLAFYWPRQLQDSEVWVMGLLRNWDSWVKLSHGNGEISFSLGKFAFMFQLQVTTNIYVVLVGLKSMPGLTCERQCFALCTNQILLL